MAQTKLLNPPLYIQYTPKLFNAWHRWSTTYQEDPNIIRPMGQIIGPGWMRTEFDSLEVFYQYYLELLEQEVL